MVLSCMMHPSLYLFQTRLISSLENTLETSQLSEMTSLLNGQNSVTFAHDHMWLQEKEYVCVCVFVFLLGEHMPYKTFEDLITKEKRNIFHEVQLKASSLVQSILSPSLSAYPYHLFQKQKLCHSTYETMQDFLRLLHPAQVSGSPFPGYP